MRTNMMGAIQESTDEPAPAAEDDSSGFARIEIYKTYVATATSISNNRQSANQFYGAANAALIAFGANLLNSQYSDTLPEIGRQVLVSAAGIALCFAWYRLIRSYRELNTAKFNVIHSIEARLPLAPHQAEWEAVGHGEDRKRYLPFTHIEQYLPWVFIALHGASLLLALGSPLAGRI